MKKLTAVVAAILAAFAAPSFAETTTELYVGGGVTKPSIDTPNLSAASASASIDEDVGYHISLGVHGTFDNNFVVGVELGRVAADSDVVVSTNAGSANISLDVDALYLGGLFGYKIADRIIPYFRLGYVRVETEASAGAAIRDTDDSGIWGGVGVMAEIIQHDNITFGIRGDYSRFSSDSKWATADVFLKFAF